MSLGILTKRLRENRSMSFLGYIGVLVVDPYAATTRSNASFGPPVKVT